MKLYEAKKIITKVFENPFNRNEFKVFVNNMLKNIHSSEFHRAGIMIPRAFDEFIISYDRIGKYEDEEGNLIDVLTIKLKNDHSVDIARSTQRNFVRWYMKDKGKDAILAAFHTETSREWRFSFIKMEYSLEKKADVLTPAKRSSFIVGESGKSHTAQCQLIDFLLNDNAPSLTEIEDAFSIEAVSNEFYEKYKSLLFNIDDEIKKILNLDNIVRNEFESKNIKSLDFSKKLLGQIVFLYFLQKKGWMGLDQKEKYGEGNKNFLRTLFNKMTPGENFFNDYLEFLFYDALSKIRVTDYYDRLKTRIPFLNGGLFDPIGFYDWQKTDIVIPNEIFSNRSDDYEGDGILDIFDLYNFTVKEDEPLEKEVAIDPEMLGKVFERMLDVTERKSKGAYYTPREVVHYMSQQSLLYFLENELTRKLTKDLHLDNLNNFSLPDQNEQSDLSDENMVGVVPKTDLETYIHYGEHIIDDDIAVLDGKLKKPRTNEIIPESIKKHAEIIDQALKNIKICDPAVGSGAFPVGMMNEIVKLRILLTPFLKSENADCRNSYNFKSNAIQNSLYGVDIDAGAVEITKLRLWLSLVVDEERINNIEPLPNLEYKIVQGNSLLNIPDGTVIDDKLVTEIEKLTTNYYTITDKQKKHEQKKIIDTKINQLLASASEFAGYNINFDFKLIFHEVWNNKNGFDIVIGNPPYVKEFTDKSAFYGTHSQECYQGKMDLWYLFGCKGIELINSNNGLLTFIATNNWITNSGASRFRNKVLQETRILEFIDFGDYKIFDSASIQTMVVILQKTDKNFSYSSYFSKIANKNIKRYELEAFLKKVNSPNFDFFTATMSKTELMNHPINFLRLDISTIVNTINKISNFKLTGTEIAQGIVLPQDFLNRENEEVLGGDFKIGEGIFNLTDEQLKNLNLSEVEKKLIKPFYTTNELHKYYGSNKNTLWLIYTDSSFKYSETIKPYPNIKRHLDRFKEIITSDNKPYGLHRARDESFFTGEKIISLRKCNRPTFTYSDFDCYVSQTFFVIKTDKINLKYLTAILNSEIIAFWLKYKGKMQGDNFQIDKEPLLNIPICKTDDPKPFIKIVDYILYLKSKSFDNMSFYFEQLIDGMVYELYFEKEIKFAGCGILKNLSALPDINNYLSDLEKEEIITKVFDNLYDKESPVRKNLFFMDSVEDIAIIKKSFKK